MRLTTKGITPAEWTKYIEQGTDFHAFYEELVTYVAAMKENSLEGPKYAHYYPINLQRMKRGIKTLQPDPAFADMISRLTSPLTWVIIDEQWCGDGAQTIPLFYKLEQMSKGMIKLVLVYRDQNLELMDEFLTNGGRSIPKLIQLDADFNVTGTWGPRPEPAQELVNEYRKRNEPYADALHAWYAKDRYATQQTEVIKLLQDHLDAEKRS